MGHSGNHGYNSGGTTTVLNLLLLSLMQLSLKVGGAIGKVGNRKRIRYI